LEIPFVRLQGSTAVLIVVKCVLMLKTFLLLLSSLYILSGFILYFYTIKSLVKFSVMGWIWLIRENKPKK